MVNSKFTSKITQFDLRWLWSSVLLLLTATMPAQIPLDQIDASLFKVEGEYTEVLSNSDVMLVGERLLYKVVCFSKGENGRALSKMSYVELRDRRDSTIFRHKLRLTDGWANGFFFLPSTLETGLYRLLSYTRHSLNNQVDGIASETLIIINPFRAPVNSNAGNPQQKFVGISLANSVDSLLHHGIGKRGHIRSSASSYARRAPVAITLDAPSEHFNQGTYTLSVRKVDPVEIDRSDLLEGTIEVRSDGQYFIPEFRGELVSGQVKRVEGDLPVSGAFVSLSIPHRDYFFRLARTNGQGRFFISLDEAYHGNEMIVQIIGQDRENYQINVDDKSIHMVDLEELPQLKLAPNLSEWLTERSIQVQVQNVYFDRENQLQTEVDEPRTFYVDIGTNYILDEYTRFPTIRETFIEVIKTARVRGKEGERVFEIFDPLNPYNVGVFAEFEPLVLMDGLPIKSAEEVLQIGSHDIESIYVLPQPYRYGPMIFRGIIDFRTKKGEFRPISEGTFIKKSKWDFPREVTLRNKVVGGVDVNARIPDQRVQLLWDPDFRFFEKSTVVNFQTSDVPGVYRVHLQGFDEEGDLIEWEHLFTVQ